MILSRRALLPLLLLPSAAYAEQLDPAVLMARLASVPDRHASFREERTLAALTTPLISTGTLSYRRPDYLEKDTLWPVPERMVIDGNRLIITDPASNDPPHVIPLDVDPGLHTLIDAMRAPLAGDLDTLRRAFTVAATGTLSAWSLTLIPKAASVLTRVGLGGRDSWIASIQVTQSNGDTSMLTITPA